MAHLFGAPKRKAAASLERRADRVMSTKSGGKPEDKRDDETEDEFEQRRREQRPGETVQEYRERKKCDEQRQPDDEETDGDAKAARMRERARCAAIMRLPVAAKRPDVAAHLAFYTDLTRNQAATVLLAAAAGEPPIPPPVAKRDGFSARMDRLRSPQLGNGFGTEVPDASTPDGLARQILAAAGMPVELKGRQQ